jgi:hypothetical protein
LLLLQNCTLFIFLFLLLHSQAVSLLTSKQAAQLTLRLACLACFRFCFRIARSSASFFCTAKQLACPQTNDKQPVHLALGFIVIIALVITALVIIALPRYLIIVWAVPDATAHLGEPAF